MRIVFQLLIILGVLLGFGAAKLRFEAALSQDMVENKLIQPPLKKGTSLRLGQTSAAVALGGLRSLVASAWNFRAFLQFEDLDWIKLEESYGIITSLQPQTIQYWDTGAWHLHTNASVYYNENPDLPPFRRRALRQLYINKGSELLEEGLRQNPDNWRLHLALARIWSDPHKLPDYPRAVRHYQDTSASSTTPDYKKAQLKRFTFYVMCKIPERRAEALELGREIFRTSDRNHTPNLVCCIFALQNELNTPLMARIPEDELFPDKERQLKWLSNYWKHRKHDYPMAGVKSKIEYLEQAPNF
ncbi:hypothetical protein JIN77_07480 [Verrucomicrobiaceae bacterium R5-34]|uniref:Uncharacterized protein n=1 Tax=Oceaniferula flava TaxID=2800421 RepID=A0AAE2SA87_9BACT|nr:hypothetical protein [Oceaniferula flavus]MBK1830562.1 hypothetical protein [Verrucomicrobiaceae bacterium R5-34]MBK1854658.1 hypothetical protein [Oceaniferula flavus]MBM1135964.1 hypothetical protein [Oceaniferula flavus]